MKGEPTTFWGKLRHEDPFSRKGAVVAWHPLVDHCADVAACHEVLLRDTLIGARLAATAGRRELDETTIQRLSVLAVLHDVGKLLAGFTARAFLPAPFATCGHVDPMVATLYSDVTALPRIVVALDVETLQSWAEGDAFASLLLAALSHHGRPVRRDTTATVQDVWWEPFRGFDPVAGIADLVRRARDWYPGAWSRGGPLLPADPRFHHAWAGVLMLADWLGSDDDRFFPFSESLAADRMELARPRAREAVAAIGLDGRRARLALTPLGDPFGRVSPHPPRAAQQELCELPLPQKGGSLTILEAETGSGKTEAAYAWFLRLLEAGLVDGIYFALPTRTAATQIYRRTDSAMRRAMPAGGRPTIVQAVPGYCVVDGVAGQRLPHFRVQWPDDVGDELRWRSWAAEHPKRALAGGVVVGTIDQALLSAIRVSHAHLRAAALSRQLLVVDEVHASDTYMTRLLEEVLARHVGAGGHALLMSATLGAAAREGLVAAATGRQAVAVGLDAAIAVAYPAITCAALDTPTQCEPVGKDAGERSKLVRVELGPILEHEKAVAERALAAAALGARVLVVRNTVVSAVATQLALEAEAAFRGLERLLWRCHGVTTLHHGRFSRPDRALLDDAIEADLGAKRPATPGLVVVSTQTCEQSLDLDADFLVTDLCPIDVLLQRIGRLHRHVRDRRAGEFELPRVVVLVPALPTLAPLMTAKRRPAGLGTVYDDLRALEATRRVLAARETLAIPEENRLLVESALHPQVLAAIDAEGAAWARWGREMRGRARADRQIGERGLVDRRVPFDAENRKEIEFPRDEKIATRLGAEDRLARFAPAVPSPFGAEVGELCVPHHLIAAGTPSDAEPSQVVVRNGGVAFRFFTAAFVYDRLGLRSAT